MNNNLKIIHRLSIDLNRSIDDIKNNMSINEFNDWVEYYSEETTLSTISIQLAKLEQMFHAVNFDNNTDLTIFDFIPNATQEEKEEARKAYKQSKIQNELDKLI